MVIETPAFLASAADEGIGSEERVEIVSYIAANPDAGALMPGTGGARKVRIAARGRGKSGGYRVRGNSGVLARYLQQGVTGQSLKGRAK